MKKRKRTYKRKTVEEKPSPFTNGEDPLTVTIIPDEELKPKEEIKPEDDVRTADFKKYNVTEEEVLFVKKIKTHMNINSDESYRLWTIYLHVIGHYPRPNDRFCSHCLSKAISELWNVIGANLYKKYLEKENK